MSKSWMHLEGAINVLRCHTCITSSSQVIDYAELNFEISNCFSFNLFLENEVYQAISLTIIHLRTRLQSCVSYTPLLDVASWFANCLSSFGKKICWTYFMTMCDLSSLGRTNRSIEVSLDQES